MNLIKDDIKKLFYKFLIPAISSSLAIAIYSLVDTIAIGHGAGPDGTAACAIVLPIFSIALFIALLCGIGSLAIAIYSLVDTIAIGHGAGPDGTAACAIVLPIFSIALFIALLCGIGGSVLMAHARGEGNREKGDAYFAASIVLVTIITLIVWIIYCTSLRNRWVCTYGSCSWRRK